MGPCDITVVFMHITYWRAPVLILIAASQSHHNNPQDSASLRSRCDPNDISHPATVAGERNQADPVSLARAVPEMPLHSSATKVEVTDDARSCGTSARSHSVNGHHPTPRRMDPWDGTAGGDTCRRSARGGANGRNLIIPHRFLTEPPRIRRLGRDPNIPGRPQK
jgi:hypothetical protein